MTHPVVATLTQLLERQRTMEMCPHCGHVGPAGEHESVDLDGQTFPACEGAPRLHAALWHTRTLWWEPDRSRKLAQSYAVRSTRSST